MRDDRGFRTIPGQQKLDQAREMGWEGPHMNYLEGERRCQRTGLPRKCQEITDRRWSRKSWTWLCEAWQDPRDGKTWTEDDSLAVSQF